MNTIFTRILHNINKNGFPEKKVALPFRPIFDACKNDGVKLSDILKDLASKNIFHTMKDDKIIFHDGKEENKQVDSNQKNPFGISENMFQQAMEQMGKMDPEQLKKLQEKVMNMSTEEREKMMKAAQNFTKNNS